MRIFLTFLLAISVIVHSIGCSMVEDDAKNGFTFMSIGFGVLSSAVVIIISYITIV